jgi:glyoxylase-like metal-dependent hydrolase (beta-lactamase superfamily II)
LAFLLACLFSVIVLVLCVTPAYRLKMGLIRSTAGIGEANMTQCITALEYADGIVAMDSGMVRSQMTACYLLDTATELAVVETGNNFSTERILAVIAHRGRRVEEVSHVIVTHVHLDHAGGAGSLMQRLPNARLVVHPRGARHMIDPSRLEASARAVYGDEEYEAQHGPLQPVPEDRILVMEDGGSVQVAGRRLEFMDTPGHARHHFCVWDEASRGWFSGDTFGISYRETDTEKGAFIFPTTTPIQFDPPALLESIDRLMARKPEFMYLTHFGRVGELPGLAAELRAGVAMFAEWGETFATHESRRERIEQAMMSWLVERARRHGVDMADAALRELFRGDVILNTQGIEFWLDHGR